MQINSTKMLKGMKINIPQSNPQFGEYKIMEFYQNTLIILIVVHPTILHYFGYCCTFLFWIITSVFCRLWKRICAKNTIRISCDKRMKIWHASQIQEQPLQFQFEFCDVPNTHGKMKHLQGYSRPKGKEYNWNSDPTNECIYQIRGDRFPKKEKN